MYVNTWAFQPDDDGNGFRNDDALNYNKTMQYVPFFYRSFVVAPLITFKVLECCQYFIPHTKNHSFQDNSANETYLQLLMLLLVWQQLQWTRCINNNFTAVSGFVIYSWWRILYCTKHHDQKRWPASDCCYVVSFL